MENRSHIWIGNSQSTSWFKDITQISQSESFEMYRQFKEDNCRHKLDLSQPYYTDDNHKPLVFPIVKTAQRVIANDSALNKEYLHPFGYDTFNYAAVKLLLGKDSAARLENRAFGVQTISAKGAIRIGAEFLATNLGMKTVYSTKENIEHIPSIFLRAGFQEYRPLRYYNSLTLTVEVQDMLQDLSQAEEGSVLFLQVCGHNPTGRDPTLSQWGKIMEIVVARKLFVFLYSHYQGLSTGNLAADVAAVRLFEENGIEFFCAQSFAWNFGLYNERVGCLTVVVNEVDKVNHIKSHLIEIINNMYTTPPSYGARIIAFILNDRILSERWTSSLVELTERLKSTRCYLREELERLGTTGSWQHITNQIGNFCLTGLNELQVDHLKKHYHIYILSNGRLTISAVNLENVQYVAKAIFETLSAIPRIYASQIM